MKVTLVTYSRYLFLFIVTAGIVRAGEAPLYDTVRVHIVNKTGTPLYYPKKLLNGKKRSIWEKVTNYTGRYRLGNQVEISKLGDSKLFGTLIVVSKQNDAYGTYTPSGKWPVATLLLVQSKSGIVLHRVFDNRYYLEKDLEKHIHELEDLA